MLAELPPAAEAEVHPGIAGIVVAVLDGLVRVILVSEAHESVIVPVRIIVVEFTSSWSNGVESKLSLPVIPIVN